MEEKERYIRRFENCIEDDVMHITYCANDRISICKLLNQQDKRIKKLEEENQQLNQQLENTQNSYNKTMKYLNTIRSKLLSLPDKIFEDIKNTAYINSLGGIFIDIYDLDKILKKYGG